MAGHSKWKNIMHKKGAADAKRGKVFTKLIKEISVAVKTGGGPDIESNPRLRLAVANAKGLNMPKDNIERAIKKASGAGGEDYIECTFEAFGPGGIALFIECATDNKIRTVGNIRSYLAKHGGNLGKDGCLQFMFERKGIFSMSVNGLDEEEFTMEMIDAGALDVEFDDDVSVICAMEDFGNIQRKLQELELEPLEASLQRISNDNKKIDEESFKKFIKLLEIIEDDDDVQKVYHNVEFDEELLEKLA